MQPRVDKGQSIIEVLVAVTIGFTLVLGAASLITPSLKSNAQALVVQNGTALENELMSNVRTWSEGDWHNLLNLATSSNFHYYLNTATSPFQVIDGDETVTIGNDTFLRYFYVNDVCRDSSGNAGVCNGSNLYDPSTKQVTVGYRLLNENGTFNSTWSLTNPSPSTSGFDPAFTFGNVMYVISAADQSTYFGTIGTTGTIAAAWNSTSTPPAMSASMKYSDAAEYDGYVYVGSIGNDFVSTSTVDYGQLSPATGVVSWQSATPLPISETGAAITAYHGYLYVVGGLTTTTVFFAPISSANGSIGAWSSTTPTPALSSEDAEGQVVGTSGYLFLKLQSTGNADYAAQVNATGSIGAWNTVTPPPTSGGHNMGLAAYDGYIFATGGVGSGGVEATSVKIVPVEASGTLGNWITIGAVPLGVWASRLIVKDPYMYSVGGFTSSSVSLPTSTIQYGTLFASGFSAASSNASTYLSRSRNYSYIQSDWSGGPGQLGPVTSTNNLFSTSTNISYASGTGELFLITSTSSVSSTFVQVTSTLISSTNSGGSVSFATSTTSGDTLLVAAAWRGSQSVTSSLADTENNTFIPAFGPVNAADGKTTAEIWYASNVPNATDTITMSLASNESSTVIQALEYESIGPLPVDMTAWNSSTTGQSLDSGGATTSGSNDLIFGFGVANPPTSKPSSSGSGFTSRATTTASMVEDESAHGIGNYHATMSATASSSWLMAMVGLKFLSQGSGSVPNIITTIAQDGYAWNDSVGWIRFGDGYVSVGTTGLSGYATTNGGTVSLDCSSSPVGNICGNSNYQVVNDGLGNLSGWAWNDQYGWIAFYWGNTQSNEYGGNSSACSTYLTGGGIYCGVYIDSAGNFHGYAWNDEVGWISFNCADPGLCGNSNYEVKTTWSAGSAGGTLDSSIFDTGDTEGAQLNSFMWEGTLPSDAEVEFQFAVSNSSSGPWNYMGPSGDATTWYGPVAANVPTKFSYTLFDNYRYFRYRIGLVQGEGSGLSSSPVVNDVIINWSP